MTKQPKVPEAKAEIHSAVKHLRRAVSLLDEAGWAETADELAREITLVRIQLNVIEIIEKSKPWPEGVPSLGPKMMRQAQGVERDRG